MAKAKTVAIIQARMGSSRLPGKVLLDLAGRSVLDRVIARLRRARLIDALMVATTADSSDDPLALHCMEEGIACSRGSVFDVLDRYRQAAAASGAEVIVRVTADCPMIDPEEVDRVIATFQESGCDFAANRLPPPFERSTPIGMDTEVCSRAALERAWQEAHEPYEREHVMPYLYAVPGRFKEQVLDMRPPWGICALRWTPPGPGDGRLVYAYFGGRDDFSLQELLAANEAHPEWQAMVSTVVHKGFRDVDARAAGGEA